MVRIANIGLDPGSATVDQLIADVKRGIYIEGHGSYSIDQRRYNFQFGGDAFWLIENGKRTHMLRDVIYHGITPEFWGSLDAICSAPEWRRLRGAAWGRSRLRPRSLTPARNYGTGAIARVGRPTRRKPRLRRRPTDRASPRHRARPCR